MSLLYFNCRGLALLRRTSSKVVFLSETKRSCMEMEIMRPRLGDYHAVYMDCCGRVGGLALLWAKTVNLRLQSNSSNHMDAHICWEGEEEVCWFTSIYGWLETQHKHKTCAMIADLSTHSNLPWVVGKTLTRSSTIQRKKGDQIRLNSSSTYSGKLLLMWDCFTWASKAMSLHGIDAKMAWS